MMCRDARRKQQMWKRDKIAIGDVRIWMPFSLSGHCVASWPSERCQTTNPNPTSERVSDVNSVMTCLRHRR